jgi:basic amino acid/polyamine antiporter, APA family
MTTTGIVFITFLGFEIIATVAEEIKNPGKTSRCSGYTRI